MEFPILVKLGIVGSNLVLCLPHTSHYQCPGHWILTSLSPSSVRCSLNAQDSTGTFQPEPSGENRGVRRPLAVGVTEMIGGGAGGAGGGCERWMVTDCCVSGLYKPGGWAGGCRWTSSCPHSHTVTQDHGQDHVETKHLFIYLVRPSQQSTNNNNKNNNK